MNNGWDLWQVVNSRLTSIGNVIVIYEDTSIMESLYSVVNIQKVFSDMNIFDIKIIVKVIFKVKIL